MLDNAKIIVLGNNGVITSTIDVMFNPAEYSYIRKAKFSNPKSGKPEFLGYEFEPFTVSLFYDTYEERRDVRKLTDIIAALVEPSLPAQVKRRQPECIFIWGRFSLRGIIERIEQKFTMFLDDGTPVRVTLNITIIPTPQLKEIQKLLGMSACRKLWVVKSGDRLDLIASQTYKDPAQWRKIASENRIDDPLSFPTKADVGRTLIIPDLVSPQ